MNNSLSNNIIDSDNNSNSINYDHNIINVII